MANTTAPGGPDLSMQRWVTIYLLLNYSAMMLAFLAGMVVLIVWAAGDFFDVGPLKDLPNWIAAAIAWMQGILGSQIGTMTGSVKDAAQFWLGSSFGSKTKKDVPPSAVAG